MPYAPEHKIETRARILDSARRLFNRHGLTAVSVDDIMAGAGLTRGGFYGHFASKEELYAEAITHFITAPPSARWQAPVANCSQGGAAIAHTIVESYLSREHMDDVDGSCPVVGLASDIARSNGAAKRACRQVVEMMVGIFARNLGPDSTSPASTSEPDAQDETRRALAVVAMCVGGMVLARAVDDQGFADDVRAAARHHAIKLAGWEGAANAAP